MIGEAVGSILGLAIGLYVFQTLRKRRLRTTSP